MTYLEQLDWDLRKAGLTPVVAALLVMEVQADPEVAPLDVRWHDHGLYPGAYNQLWPHAERHALAWIAANAPDHPARKKLDRENFHIGVVWERTGQDQATVTGWGRKRVDIHTRKSLESYKAMIDQRYVKDMHAIEDGFAALDAPYTPGPEEPLIELPDSFYQRE